MPKKGGSLANVLYVVVEEKLIRMRTQPQGIMFLALVLGWIRTRCVTTVRLTTDPFRKTRRGKLNCLLASFLGSDPDRVFDGTDKNFTVANLARFGCFNNRVDG